MYFERRQINSDCVFPAAHALVQARGRFSQKNKKFLKNVFSRLSVINGNSSFIEFPVKGNIKRCLKSKQS